MLQEVYEKYDGQFEMISITKEDPNHPDGLEKSREYVAENNLSWLFSEDQHMIQPYEFTKIPHTVFINEYGYIFWIQSGFADALTVETQVCRMLNLPLPEVEEAKEAEDGDTPAKEA